MDRFAPNSTSGVQPVGDMTLDNLHTAWMRSPTPTLSTHLLKQLNPTIQKAITTHVGPTASPTIKSRAKMLALDAAQSFQPSSGAKLPTHVFSQLQSLKRYAGQEGMVVGIPERMAIQRRRLDRVTSDFKNENGRDPSDDEISSLSGLNVKELSKLRRLPAVINEGRFYDTSNPEASPDLPAVENHAKPQQAWLNFIYHNSSEQDKVLLEHSFGLNGKPKLDNMGIAAKLGVTPAAISQRKVKLQEQLDHYHSRAR